MSEAIIYLDAQGKAQVVSTATPLPTTPISGVATGVQVEDAPHVSGDTGFQSLGVRNDGTNTVLTSANGDYGSIAVDDRGVQFVRDRPAASAATAVVVMAASTNQTLQAANQNRRGLAIYNGASAVLNVKLGATASATSFAVVLAVGGYYEVPGNYSGIVDGWTTGTGPVNVTEIN